MYVQRHQLCTSIHIIHVNPPIYKKNASTIDYTRDRNTQSAHAEDGGTSDNSIICSFT